MNILLYSNDFDISNIYFLDKKKNMIMDGVFTKIIYSNNCISMNGLYIDVPIKNIINKNNSKNIIQFDAISNKEIIQKMVDIEKQLLNYYVQYFSLSYEKRETNIQNKTIIYNLKNQIQNGSIKYYKEYEYYSQKPCLFYIKFSGIWENQTEIGITFKLIEYQKKI
jgi:hypothetical protein